MSSSHFDSTPPSGPRAEQAKSHHYSSGPARGSRREDSREEYYRRSRSPPYRRDHQSPPRRGRSRDRDSRRDSYENNYRPRYNSRSPVRRSSARSPLEEKRSYDSYRSGNRPPLEERGANNSYSPPPQNRVPPLTSTRPPATVTAVIDQPSEPSKLTPPPISDEMAPRADNMEESSVQKQQPQQPTPSEIADVNIDASLQDELSLEFGNKVLVLLNECTEMSSLKAQQHTEKQRLNRRTAEFEKFKAHHEKFPSSKESQTNAKTSAEKAYKLVSDKIRQKENSLAKTARETAAYFIPSILDKGRGNLDSSEVEKRLQETSDNFTKLFNEQKRLLAQQQKLSQSLEERLQKRDEEYSKLVKSHEDQRAASQQEINYLKSTLDSISNQVNGAVSSIQVIKDDVCGVKKDAATQAKGRDDANERLTDVENLARRVNDMNKMQTRLTKLESSSVFQDTFYGLEKKCEEVASICKTNSEELGKQAQSQNQSQNSLALRLTKVETSMVEKKDLDPIRERVKKLDLSANSPAPQVQPDYSMLIKKHIEPLDQRLAAFSGVIDGLKISKLAPSLTTSAPSLESSQISAFKAQVDKVETTLTASCDQHTSDINSLKAKVAHLETNKPKDSADKRLVNLEKRVGDQELLISKERASFNTRLNNLEQRPAAQVPTAADQAQQLSTTDASSLKALEDRLELVEEQLSDVAPLAGELVNEAVKRMQGDLEQQQVNTNQLKASINALTDNHNNLIRQTSDVSNISLNVSQTLVDKGVFSRKEVVNGLLDTVESHEAAIDNLQARVDNINTSDLHHAMVSTLVEAHLEGSTVIGDFNARLGRLQSSLLVLQSVNPRVIGLESQVSELTTTIVGLSGSTERVQNMRKEIDSLVTEVSRAQSASKKAVDDLKGVQSEVEKDRDEAANRFVEVYNKIAILKEDVEKVEKANADIILKQKATPTPTPAPACPPPPPRHISPAGSFSSVGRGVTNSRPTSRPGSASSRRPSSAASDQAPSDRGRTVSESKKRPFKQSNGSLNLKPNGSNTDSPAAKRPRRRLEPLEFPQDDTQKDPTYHPSADFDDDDVAVPTISDTDDSDE
ncbi:uncharacterized protein LY89DRAFT_318522 [Mollisia scopiformis]|uniref:Uncharacterized protein n=1 Tax=Mollisia scopiformis TaxID=149040 RepID=A0A132BBM2_MOLSC|nr:uncharacterized protein LY89DRAFT_318522 [Mollisia scopiformis]KUJ09047.1 hypothetical protein LY89DRAFT_318522 [Mollisia scopiformis]